MSQPTQRKYLRFKMSAVIQHMLLALSYIGLMVSGYALGNIKVNQNSPQSYFASSGLDWEQIHIISGVILGITLFWHIFYILFSIYGHNDFMQMFLKKSEFKSILKFGLYGGLKEKSRFGLQEKVTYWVIGSYTLLMFVTGVLRFTHRYSTNFLPQWSYNLMVEFHSYYGLLLGLILFVWHLYSIFLKPGRFPGTLSWWDGMITENEMIRRGIFEKEEKEDKEDNFSERKYDL